MSTLTRVGIRHWIQCHPMTSFLSLGLLGSYALLTLLVLVDREVLPGRGVPGLVGADMEEAASFVLVLTLVAAAATVTYLEGGRPALTALVRRAMRWRVPLRWWMIAVVAIPATSLLLALVLGDTFVAPTPGTLLGEAVSIALALIFANLAEETAWAGFLQTRLERRHSFVVAALLTAVPFALVHLPIRVVAREITAPGDVVGNLVALLIVCAVIRLLLGAVMRGARNSVLLVAVTHLFFNRSNNEDGLVADLVEGDARSVSALLATVLVTVVLTIATRRNLRLSRRLTLDAREG
jgi:membrane protease YdiL (CAAX protease family)